MDCEKLAAESTSTLIVPRLPLMRMNNRFLLTGMFDVTVSQHPKSGSRQRWASRLGNVDQIGALFLIAH